MANILILYDTAEGQTRKIAGRMAETAAADGHEAEVREIKSVASPLVYEVFDGVLVGGSIHAGKHSPRLIQWVSRQKAAFESRPTAFFSVSLSAAGNEQEREQARRYVAEFLEETGWTPAATATFAGGLMYREYGLLKRWMMKKIAKDSGKDTDTRKNHEYTDWAAVERFVRDFVAGLKTD